MIDQTALLTVDHVSKHYEGGTEGILALDKMTFHVQAGEFLAIMGPSGSGKTTLLNCIATMIRPTSGSILLRDTDLTQLRGRKLSAYRGKQMGYIFQEFGLLDNLTARENILLPLALHGLDKKGSEKLTQLASQLDIAALLDQFPSRLSSGEKQRVAAARALIGDPDLLLADEPTGSLDSKNAKRLMDQLSAIHQAEHTTILMVTHDASVASYAGRILFIQDGRIFHELRTDPNQQDRPSLYDRVIKVQAQLGGGSAHVL